MPRRASPARPPRGVSDHPDRFPFDRLPAPPGAPLRPGQRARPDPERRSFRSRDGGFVRPSFQSRRARMAYPDCSSAGAVRRSRAFARRNHQGRAGAHRPKRTGTAGWFQALSLGRAGRPGEGSGQGRPALRLSGESHRRPPAGKTGRRSHGRDHHRRYRLQPGDGAGPGRPGPAPDPGHPPVLPAYAGRRPGRPRLGPGGDAPPAPRIPPAHGRPGPGHDRHDHDPGRNRKKAWPDSWIRSPERGESTTTPAPKPQRTRRS